MAVQSVRFLGVRTAAAGEMVRLFRDVLGLEPMLERPGATLSRLADGTRLHVDDEEDESHALFGPGPAVGLVVDHVDAVQARMTESGIVFSGDPQREGTTAWNHFRPPDGNAYEIMGPDRAGDAGSGGG